MPSLLGALEAAGNVLDLPVSSVRDVLAWRNPLDQWASPLQNVGRTSAAELLKRYGITSGRQGIGNTMASIGTDIFLDPLSLLGAAEVKHVPALVRALRGGA